MSIQSSMEWEIDAATGNANNGGGYDGTSGTPGTNYAWGLGQTTIAYTDLETDGGTLSVMCSVARPFIAADVGNVINITAGTHATTGRYQILSVAGGKATVDRNWATEDNTDHNDGAGTLGGALAGIVNAFFQSATSPIAAGNKIWLKYNAATYSFGTAANITAGPAGSATAPILLSGYYSTHGDNPTIASGNQPTIAHSTYGWAYGNDWVTQFLTRTAATTSSTYAVTIGAGGRVRCEKLVHSGSGRGYNVPTYAILLDAEISGTGSVGVNLAASSLVRNCYVHDCGRANSIGIYANGATSAIIEGNAVESCTFGLSITNSSSVYIHNNTIVNCKTGVYGTTASFCEVANNIIAYCGTGILWDTQTDINFFENNNIYGCDAATSGVATTGTWAPVGGTTNDPSFVTSVATGADGATNASPGTTFTSAGSNFSTVSTSDYLCVWSGTGATVGVYAISAVAPGGDNTKLTLATSPGNSASAIHFGIVKGGTSTNLSLSAGSACLGAGHGIGLGVG